MDRHVQDFRLAEFEFHKRLGVGGFGVTYLALDTKLHRQVVIKEYLPLSAGKIGIVDDTGMNLRGPSGEAVFVTLEDYWFGERLFLAEARALVSLKHKHIVRAHRVVEDSNRASLVMEYVEGRPLTAELQQRPLSEPRVRRILAALADALVRLHAASLVHGDVKPANVLIRTDGDPVLIDFGAARQAMAWRSIESSSDGLLPVTSVLTPGYAALEQYNPHLKRGPWTDVYALGAIAYEALTGQRPDPAPNRMWSDRVQPVAEVALQSVSPALAAIVDAALALKPEDRPRGLRAWRQMLDDAPQAVDRVAAAWVREDREPVWSGLVRLVRDHLAGTNEFLAPGMRHGNLTIERILGRNRYGAMYLARDSSLKTVHAVKEYLPVDWGERREDWTIGPLPAQHEDYQWGLTQFLAGASILAGIRHPHVVEVQRIIESNGTVYMVMTYVEGQTLSEEMHARGGRLPEWRAREILTGLMGGLLEVHTAGLLHGDIRPTNVRVRQDGSPVLVDFEFSTGAGGGRDVSDTVYRPSPYLPAEGYRPPKDMDPRIDIYALGAMAFEALSGRVPERLREDQEQLAKAGCEDRGLAAAVDAALAIDPRDRPQTVEEWWTVLHE